MGDPRQLALFRNSTAEAVENPDPRDMLDLNLL